MVIRSPPVAVRSDVRPFLYCASVVATCTLLPHLTITCCRHQHALFTMHTGHVATHCASSFPRSLVHNVFRTFSSIDNHHFKLIAISHTDLSTLRRSACLQAGHQTKRPFNSLERTPHLLQTSQSPTLETLAQTTDMQSTMLKRAAET